MVKTKSKFVITIFMALIMLCLVILTSMVTPAATSIVMVGEGVSSVRPLHNMGAIAAASDGDSKSVIDADGNVFYYSLLDGLVLSHNGIAYDSESAPLFYDVATQEFKTSKGTPLDLLENTSDANYSLLDKSGRKVRSVTVTDSLYSVPVKANTSFNRTNTSYWILCTRIFVSNKWYEVLFKGPGYFEYYTIFGEEISDYVDAPINFDENFFEAIILGVKIVKLSLWSAKNYYGEVSSYMEEVRIYSKYYKKPYPDSFWIDPYFDDTGNYIYQHDSYRYVPVPPYSYQLFDSWGYPLVDSKGRPVFDKIFLLAPAASTFPELFYPDENNVLRTEDGFALHSIASDMLNGANYYYRVTKSLLYTLLVLILFRQS